MARRLLGARGAGKEKRPPSDSMTVWQHLGELRDRIMFSLMAVAIGAIICFIFFNVIVGWVVEPYQDATGKTLVFTNPLDAFMTRLKVSAYGGFVLGSPVVFWHLWRFVTPGLNPNEKRYAIPFVVSSVVLFMGGATVAVLTFPKALDFLLSVGGKDLEPLLTASSYLSLYFLMLVAFGVAFEFPILVTFLLLARVIETSQLKKWRRPAFVTLVIVAAVITPSQDPISLFAMAIPMYILYEASILVGRFLKR